MIQEVCLLPPAEVMWKEIKLKKHMMSRRFVTSQRHTLQVDLIPYMDEVAEQIGCKPDISKYIANNKKSRTSGTEGGTRVRNSPNTPELLRCANKNKRVHPTHYIVNRLLKCSIAFLIVRPLSLNKLK